MLYSKTICYAMLYLYSTVNVEQTGRHVYINILVSHVLLKYTGWYITIPYQDSNTSLSPGSGGVDSSTAYMSWLSVAVASA